MLDPGWYVQAVDDSDFLVSLMVDRNTGRNYLMFVNKDFQNDVDFSVRLQKIQEIRNITDGGLEPADYENGFLHMQLKAGGFALFVLGEQDQLHNETVFDEETAEGANYALGKPIYASDSVGKDGFYAFKANDGKLSSSGSSKGWMFKHARSLNKTDNECWLMIDLLRPVSVHQVTIHPYKINRTDPEASYFPASFKIQYSSDGIQWQDAQVIQDYEYLSGQQPPVFDFPAVEARYVRLYFTSFHKVTSYNVIALAEVEIR
jgi:hypothetical protein